MESRSELEEELAELLEVEERIVLQKLYQTNLYELCKLIGFNDLGECHKELCHVIEKTETKYKRRLFLLHRGSLKTSVISIANVVREIIRNPNIRILLGSSTQTNAREVLNKIKNTFWQNQSFREVFPDFCASEETKEFGTQDAFTVPARTNKMLRNHTVEAAGVGQVLVGRHYDMIMLTDIVTDKNVNTPGMIKKTSDWIKYALSLLEHPVNNRVDMEGTRYDFQDVYGEWEDLAKKESNFFIYKKPCLNDDGTPFWSERFTVEDLHSIEQEQGGYIFAGQYRLEPIDEKTSPFKKDMLNYFDRAKTPRTKEREWPWPRYMTIDPAISEEKTADHSVMTVSMFDDTNMEWVLDIEFGHWSIGTFCDKLMALYEEYKPSIIGVETVAFQKLLVHIIDDIARKKKIILPFVEVQRSTRTSKTLRIMAIQPRFAQKRIVFCDDLDKVFIENQIIRFNPAKYNNKDDLLDTIADMEEIKNVPDSVAPDIYSRYPQKRFIDWLEMTPDERDEDDYVFNELYKEEEQDVI